MQSQNQPTNFAVKPTTITSKSRQHHICVSSAIILLLNLILCTMPDASLARPLQTMSTDHQAKETLTPEMINRFVKELGQQKMLELTKDNKTRKAPTSGKLVETPMALTPTIPLDSSMWPKFNIFQLQEVWKALSSLKPEDLPSYVQSLTVCCIYNVGQMYGGGHLSGPCCHRMMQVMFLQHLGRHTNNAINDAYQEYLKNKTDKSAQYRSDNQPRSTEFKAWETISKGI